MSVKPGKAGLLLKIPVVCDKCGISLRYSKLKEGDFNERMVLIHDDTNCERARQMFSAPKMELERID